MSGRPHIESLGQRIRAWRQARGLTQQAFCKLVPTAQSYLSLVERGAAKPSVEILMTIAEHSAPEELQALLRRGG